MHWTWIHIFRNNFSSKVSITAWHPDNGTICYTVFNSTIYWNRCVFQWKIIQKESLQGNSSINTNSSRNSNILLFFSTTDYRFKYNLAAGSKNCANFCTFVTCWLSYGISISVYYQNGF